MNASTRSRICRHLRRYKPRRRPYCVLYKGVWYLGVRVLCTAYEDEGRRALHERTLMDAFSVRGKYSTTALVATPGMRVPPVMYTRWTLEIHSPKQSKAQRRRWRPVSTHDDVDPVRTIGVRSCPKAEGLTFTLRSTSTMAAYLPCTCAGSKSMDNDPSFLE